MEDAGAHPYYPSTAVLPGFVANDMPVAEMLPAFGAIVGAVVGGVYLLAARSRLRLGPADRFAAAWFALCGFLHVAFEGYYIYNRAEIIGQSALFAQLWKEYCLSDSRYLTSDVFTVTIETITVFAWGPLSWLTVFAILSDAPSIRHVLQIVVCTAHLYGVILYYGTNWTEMQFHGVAYSRPEFLYFWVYYIGFNLPWAVVPFGLLYDSYRRINRAFTALQEKEAASKGK
ncbi:Emopamil-binding protein [Stachybotrys elegans]|uniref:Emopamil-binding protein n=1 Tax=Stachybotrys elegans TaxID=80388 RepID=A0A8K0WPJ7_9HYPO|nr:Emopamil-binding protein [Stachybotrys elegans]